MTAVFSYAGRTESPVAQPLPTRVGGFGGARGLARYLRAEGITHVVDATHPFAARMSHNAVAACDGARIPLIALERPAWVAAPGDDWRHVPDLTAAVAALPGAPTRIFLAIGRQGLEGFGARPQHDYLLRLVDPPASPPLARCTIVLARGPFELAGDMMLLQSHRTELLVAKNSGGSGARAKLDAARALGLPVILIDRPAVPPRRVAGSVGEVMAWLSHADLGV